LHTWLAYLSIINLCTQIGNDRLAGEFWAHECYITLLYLFEPQAIYPFPYLFSCALAQVERLDRCWWLTVQTRRKFILSIRMLRNYFYDPKPSTFSTQYREIRAWTLMRNNFRTAQFKDLITYRKTKFDDDRSISNVMAAVFRNPRWRRTPSWFFETLHFWRRRYVPNRSPMFSQMLVTNGQIVKKWQQFFEIQDGDSRHLETYTSGWTTITRNEFLFCNFKSKI